MLLRDLTEVWISNYETKKEHGENSKIWKFKKINTFNGTAFLNLQQDVNELDRKTSGEIDYSIVNGRTTMNYDIEKGDGISLSDISKSNDIIPDYIVTDNPKIGNTTLYKMEKYNGN